jgi:RNA polymerase sigma-70 factor (ECF subfamily)
MAGVNSIHDIYMSLRESLARAQLGIVPPKEVEDIVQETYVRVCQIERKDKITEPRSFLFKVARNLALDHVKRAESRLVVSMEDNGESGFGEAERSADETFDRVASDEEFSHFCEAVRQLPVQCRRAFVLKKVYGCSQREIAGEMNLSESTVEKHIAQGIKRCTYFMMQHGEQCRGGTQVRKTGRAERLSTPRQGGRA